ncbi:MAG: ABC transporter permease, partial [Clostridia bacterium]|nr:ABC transporter permease [Clostridia bacterium]
MMNYVALQLVSYFIIIWEVPKGAGKIGIINSQTMAGWLPSVAGQKYLLNIIVVAVLTIIMHIYLNYTKQGYEISVVGESERTAHYVGIKVSRVIVRTMALSGALCALAGFLRVAGTDHTLTTTITDGYGFTAVMVSWLAQFKPITMILTSFILTFMDRGASGISTKFQLNESYADILTGIILFFIIGCEFFIRYRITFRKKGKGEE